MKPSFELKPLSAAEASIFQELMLRAMVNKQEYRITGPVELYNAHRGFCSGLQGDLALLVDLASKFMKVTCLDKEIEQYNNWARSKKKKLIKL